MAKGNCLNKPVGFSSSSMLDALLTSNVVSSLAWPLVEVLPSGIAVRLVVADSLAVVDVAFASFAGFGALEDGATKGVCDMDRGVASPVLPKMAGRMEDAILVVLIF